MLREMVEAERERESERERRGGVKEEQDVDRALKILTLFNESRLWLYEILEAQRDHRSTTRRNCFGYI